MLSFSIVPRHPPPAALTSSDSVTYIDRDPPPTTPTTSDSVTYIDRVPVTPGGRGDHGIRSADSCQAALLGQKATVVTGRFTSFVGAGYYLSTSIPLSDSITLGIHAQAANDVALGELKRAVWHIQPH